MRISGRNIPEDDLLSYFATTEPGCIKRKQTRKGILSVSNSAIPTVVTQASLLLALLLLCLQRDWHLVLATREMSSTAGTATRRSLSFVVGSNGRRTCAFLPCPSQALSMLRMTNEKSSNLPIRNEKLRSNLEEFRMVQSKALSKSPSVILPDKVVDGICALDPLPLTMEDLSKVKGMGPKKLELFGIGILDLVASSVTPKASNTVEEKDETKAKSTINSDSFIEFANITTMSSNSSRFEAAFPSENTNMTLRSSNSSFSTKTTDSVIQTGTKEKSRYINQFGFNESLEQQQYRSISNTTVAMNDSTNVTKKENETSTSTRAIEKEEIIDNLQQKDENMILRSKLEDFRMEQSKILGKSPSMILNENIIDGICSLDPLPTTMEDLSKVKGLGAKKLKLFGENILSLVSSKPGEVGAEKTTSPSDSLIAGSLRDDSSDNNDVIESSLSSSSSLDSLFSKQDGDKIDVSDTTPQVFEVDTEEQVDFDSYVAPAPYSAPEDDNAVPALDSFVAPAPYSDATDDKDFAPYSAPKGNTGIAALDSYVAPAPYSFDDEEEFDDDDFDDYEISEESFGTPSSTSTSDIKEKEEKDEPMTTTKLRKTQLKKDLKEYRMAQKDDGKAAYTVFTNAALDGIYATLPVTKSDLLEVKGIGPKKLDLYGDDILEIVAPYAGMGGQKDQNEASGDTDTPIQREKIDPETLTTEQRKAADMIFGKDTEEGNGHGRNVFVTGSAGTGKSHLLKYVVETLQGRKNLVVGVCAPTGVAAVIVGGSTLHSFFGIGLGTGTKSNLLRKVRQNNAAKTRIDETDVLIIDECSMLSADLLETLDMVARNIRRDGMFSDEPFGGMQVIAFGDFFQLPPVHKYDGNQDRSWRPFCFDSPVWSDLGLSKDIIELNEVQRQEEGDFVHLLNKVRTGRIEPRDIFDLNEKCLVGPNNPLPNDGILPTRLYVLNRDVDSENSMRLKELSGKEVICTAKDIWRQKMPLGTKASVKNKMKESMSMLMPDEVRLKIGAQVMLTRNKDLEKNLVNGSRGVVERFETNRDGNPIPIVRFDSGITTRIEPVEFTRLNSDGGVGILARMQVPLKLAWAVTIHKSQGSTLTRASLDISSAFEYGQCYVALSRVRSLDGLWLERPAEMRNVMVSPQVLDFFSKNY